MKRSLLASVLLSIALVAASQGPIFSNRWEGFATELNASPSWSLRSFVSYVEPFDATNSVDLTVRYYVPDATKAFVQAQELIPLKNYLMKPLAESPVPGWRTFAPWPTGDFLLPKQIPSSNLGMLISLGASGEGVTQFAPAAIFHSQPPRAFTTYIITFTTVSALKAFTVTVSGQSYRKSYSHAAVDGRSTVALTIDATEIPEGPTTVVMSAGHQDLALTDRVNLSVQFFHKQPN